MKKLHIAPSPITNRIYAGHVRADGCTWGANKTDVTGEACAAVAKHILMCGGEITVTKNGVRAYRLVAMEIRGGDVGREAP